jgi:guanylate kinase
VVSQQNGVLIVLSGPSGVGKGSLRHYVQAQLPQLKTSISATTRPMRPREVDGVDYFFVSRDAFEAMIAVDGLVEWAEFSGNLYGTPRQYLEDALAQGDAILLEIDVQGAVNIKRLFAQAHLIFVAPPSLDVLAQRLKKRGTDDAASIAKRLETAKWELSQTGAFDSCIINDDLPTAQHALLALIQKLMTSVVPQ